MKDRFKLFSMALCACAFAACNDNEGVDGPGDGDKSPVQYVVMSATSDGTATICSWPATPPKVRLTRLKRTGVYLSMQATQILSTTTTNC